ncbi:redoxin domain-containing protein [candidate division KSB3 bacterium]|uniref:Redoxin domain-containing protein n=1 Tax=candidate division KSB3 bacterium TaxID=2044937 RepID=A0A9D5Q7N2_9BACT|nr:redoxin domain-containing protein [candidate division KSB3 bacterium]MBD3326086.1 redoxin domain-containing protein [candidate division KSB3 bacterium]
MIRRRTWSSFVQVFIMAVLLGGMGSSFAGAEDDIFETLQVALFPEPVEAPPFSLPSVEGGEVSLSDYHGSVVFLNFWTTW